MRYLLKFARFWIYILLIVENLKPAPIILKRKDKLNNAKVERQKKQINKILTWTKSNSKCKRYIRHMCALHIQQKI